MANFDPPPHLEVSDRNEFLGLENRVLDPNINALSVLEPELVYSRNNFTQQTQAPANRNAWSKQWQPWVAACQRKRLRFLRFSFMQPTQRKRLRLNGNRASLLTFAFYQNFNSTRCTAKLTVFLWTYSSSYLNTTISLDWETKTCKEYSNMRRPAKKGNLVNVE